jgi:hypothetical protein
LTYFNPIPPPIDYLILSLHHLDYPLIKPEPLEMRRCPNFQVLGLLLVFQFAIIVARLFT